MDYIIRFSQSHESFRLPEVQSLARLEDIDLKVLSYSQDVSASHSLTLTRGYSHAHSPPSV